MCLAACGAETFIFLLKKKPANVHCLTFMQKLGYSIWEICLCLNSLVNQENQFLEVLCYCLRSNPLGMLWLMAVVLFHLVCVKYFNSPDSPAPQAVAAALPAWRWLASQLFGFLAGALILHGRNLGHFKLGPPLPLHQGVGQGLLSSCTVQGANSLSLSLFFPHILALSWL